VAAVILRPKTKEYLEGLKEVMDGSTQALQAGYKYLFLSEVTHLLTAYDYSLDDVRKILNGELVSESSASSRLTKRQGVNGSSSRIGVRATPSKTGVTRKERSYRNPHTGETISLRSSKNKILKLWQEEYGVDVVEQWRVS